MVEIDPRSEGSMGRPTRSEFLLIFQWMETSWWDLVPSVMWFIALERREIIKGIDHTVPKSNRDPQMT